MKNILIKDMQRYDFFIFSTSFPLFFLAFLFNLFVFLQNVKKLNIYVSFICFLKTLSNLMMTKCKLETAHTETNQWRKFTLCTEWMGKMNKVTRH